MHLFTKQTSLKGLRGFESLTIRHEQPPYEPTVVVSFFGVWAGRWMFGPVGGFLGCELPSRDPGLWTAGVFQPTERS